MLTFDIAGAQIDGARDYQEDAFLITRLHDAAGTRTASLVLVADGMGGHAAGNVASNMAVQTFNKHLTSHFPSANMSAVLREAVLQANNSIAETVRETAALKGMGCTLVGAVIDDRELRWVSVGDSHLYLIRDGEIHKKNADHSYGGFLARMAAQGKAIEPEAGFSRNMLMSALTGDEIADIDCPETAVELLPGDRVIIASDGLDTLNHGKILSQLAKCGSAKEGVDALLKAVQDAKMPRQDNTTVVVALVGEKAEFKPARPVAPAAARPNPALQATRPPPTASRTAPPASTTNGGGTRMLAAVVGVLLLAGGGAGWWFLAGPGSGPGGVQLPVPAKAVPDMPGESIIDESVLQEEAPEDEKAASEPVLEPTPTAGTGEFFADPLRGGGSGPAMVWLPAGRFAMGSPESSADFSERPQHEVTLRRFAISRHEVTIAEYARFASATGRRLPKTGALDRATHPVFFVSWEDASAYAKWLSGQTGKSYRLPSEAEWEYAARAGSTGNYWWGRDLDPGKAHCFACESGLDPRQPARVGSFEPNAYGLYDTAGNVEEWVADCFHDSYAGAPADGSVFAGGDCRFRVVRGGSFTSGPKALRSAARNKFNADTANDSVGFRVARDE